jgi:hypothetical protein
MGLQFHSTPLLPSAGKPAMPANRRLERSEWIGGVAPRSGDGVVNCTP